jgi:parvulin-like peptidyl-prolyl isomerase
VRGEPVLRVGQKVLGTQDLSEELDRLVPMRAFHGAITEEKRARYKDEALENLVTNELYAQEALGRGMTVEKKDLQDAMDGLQASMGGRKALDAALKRRGVTYEQYREILRKGELVKKLLDMEVTLKSEVTEEEVREYYERNKESYMRPAAWRVSHILISVDPSQLDQKEALRKRAETVLEKARAGEDFGLLAWDYSDDPYRYKEGDLGLLHKGRLMPELEDVIDRLEVGQVSDIIETIYGFHIVKLVDRTVPTQLEFEEMKQKIASEMRVRRTKELREALIERLKSQTEIEVY